MKLIMSLIIVLFYPMASILRIMLMEALKDEKDIL
jgi:hypothetical protein